MSAPTPRPGIMDIHAYVGGGSALPGRGRVIKLSSNEGALGPSPLAIEACRRVAEDIHLYPDGGCGPLRDGIARRFGLAAERIVCGNGSDELLSLLTHAYAGPGDEVLYSQHGFLMYAIAARAAGAVPVAAPEADLRADVDALLDRVTARTKILFLANPNNPTGSHLTREELLRLRAGLPEDVLLVVDAAYAEYVSRNDYSPGVEMVDAGDNVVMTRTFSKLFALAGLRLGWAYCPPPVADVLNRVRGPFNVTAPAQAAGLAALRDTEFADASRAHNDQVLPLVRDQLIAVGIDVPPSIGNFLLLRFPAEGPLDAAAANAFLNERGIIARQMQAYGLPESLRMSIGGKDDMAYVVEALSEFMAGGGT